MARVGRVRYEAIGPVMPNLSVFRNLHKLVVLVAKSLFAFVTGAETFFVGVFGISGYRDFADFAAIWTSTFDSDEPKTGGETANGQYNAKDNHWNSYTNTW